MTRGTWATGIATSVLTSITTALTQAQQAATTASQALTQASTASQMATTANTTASTANTQANTATASLAQLQAAIDAGNTVHTNLQTQITALQNATSIKSITIASGTTATPLLALNASSDVTITLDKTMPNATYNVDLILPTALVGTSTVSVKSKTATTVTLTVKATVAVGTSSIGVIAWATT